MALNVTQDQIASVSTHAQRQLLRGHLADTFTTSLGDLWIDPLSPSILNILNQAMNSLTQYQYVSGTPLTTVSYELYGTTSAWWIILYCNGYMHQDEISDGATLKVPTSDLIVNLLQVAAQGNRGKQVTI